MRFLKNWKGSRESDSSGMIHCHLFGGSQTGQSCDGSVFLCRGLLYLFPDSPSFQDICNRPNVRGTVVSLSGSPGSHNDVKYMKEAFEKHNIRLICTNWPGSEFVTGGLRDSYTNPERNSYMKALLEKLNVKKVDKLVIMGHSRSGESALQIGDMLSVGTVLEDLQELRFQDDKSWPLVGVMVLNSPGFVPHRGLESK